MDIEAVTDDEVRVLCPFHGNSDTSAMSMSIPDGMFYCFNPMCDEHGSLMEFVMKVKRCNFFSAVRLIDSAHTGSSFQVDIKKRKEKPQLTIPDEEVQRLHQNLLDSQEPIDYLHSRHITDDSIEYFRLGYSTGQNLLVTPVFNAEGECVGGIGRGVKEKVFKNIPGTKTSHSLFNIQNAKKHSTAIICESNFDAIRIHQAGYPGVVATCGGIFSDNHVEQISYYFERVIIMTDVDGKSIQQNCRKCAKSGNKYCVGHDPGRDLGDKIAERCLRVGVTPRWSSYDGYGTIYPDGVKDAGDMTDEQIRNCIENSVSNFEYNTWK